MFPHIIFQGVYHVEYLLYFYQHRKWISRH